MLETINTVNVTVQYTTVHHSTIQYNTLRSAFHSLTQYFQQGIELKNDMPIVNKC